MKKYSLFFLIFILTSCVQKSYKRTVVLKLKVAGINGIQAVGLRGNDKPLSWNEDLLLVPVIKDSVYTGTFSSITGYNFTEIKFTINGDYELKEKENRRIYFNNRDTTYYEAAFNEEKNIPTNK